MRTCFDGPSSISDIRRRQLLVARPHGGHVLQEPAVDLVDDLQVPRHDALEQRDGPLLQRLRHQGVVRVAHRRLRDLPGLLPREVALVDEDAHQLRHRERGMGVVQLDGDLVREGVEAPVIALVARDDVPERAGDQEVFLDETQLVTGRDGVGRIEHLGDGLRRDLLFHGFHVVAGVEDLHVEVVRRPRGEEAEHVHRPAAVADDRIVVGHADQEPPVQPHRVVLAPAVHPVLDAAVDGDQARLLGPLDRPGRREREPVVRLLRLLAVLDLLAEQAVLVVDAVAVAGHVERGQRIEEAGREPAQPAVAERGVALALFHVGEVGPEVSQRVPAQVVEAEVAQVVGEGPTEQVLDGEVVHVLGVRPPLALPGLLKRIDHHVAHGEPDAVEALARDSSSHGWATE